MVGWGGKDNAAVHLGLQGGVGVDGFWRFSLADCSVIGRLLPFMLLRPGKLDPAGQSGKHEGLLLLIAKRWGEGGCAEGWCREGPS